MGPVEANAMPSHPPARGRDQRGSVLTLVLGFMVVLLVIAAGVHGMVLRELTNSGTLRQRIAATELAEGGLARARAWFVESKYQVPAATAVTGVAPVRLKSTGQPIVLPAAHPDDYTDALGAARKGIAASYKQYLSDQQTVLGAYSVVATLIASQPETWETIATATVGREQQTAGAIYVREFTSLFADAIFGRTGITMNGNASTDSYDASLGAYGGANVFGTGNVRSNANISLVGNAQVRGDAMPGPEGVVTGKTGSVTGLKDAASREKDLPPAAVPAGAVSLGAVDLKGKSTQTLTAGTYTATSLEIAGNARLIIDASKGPVNLYVTGTIALGGNGVLNASGQPRNFNLVQVGNAGVTVSGNSDFVGTIYAPDSALKINGNGALYGAFVGAAVDLNGNAAIHYDLSLKDLGVPGPLRVVAAWRRPVAAN